MTTEEMLIRLTEARDFAQGVIWTLQNAGDRYLELLYDARQLLASCEVGLTSLRDAAVRENDQ